MRPYCSLCSADDSPESEAHANTWNHSVAFWLTHHERGSGDRTMNRNLILGGAASLLMLASVSIAQTTPTSGSEQSGSTAGQTSASGSGTTGSGNTSGSGIS